MNDVKAITDEWRHMERLAIEAEGQFHSALAAYHRGVSRIPPPPEAAETARELRRIADAKYRELHEAMDAALRRAQAAVADTPVAEQG